MNESRGGNKWIFENEWATFWAAWSHDLSSRKSGNYSTEQKVFDSSSNLPKETLEYIFNPITTVGKWNDALRQGKVFKRKVNF